MLLFVVIDNYERSAIDFYRIVTDMTWIRQRKCDRVNNMFVEDKRKNAIEEENLVVRSLDCYS